MLPKIDVPIYTMDLISTGKKVKFRPFTVKEEKLFLMASESEDVNSAIDTIKQVVRNCIVNDVDVDKLPIFDIENIFLNLRARSIGEVVDLKYKCNNDVTDETGEQKKCNNVVELSINVLDIKPEKNENHSNKVEITDKLGVVLKYPSFDSLKYSVEENQIDSTLNLIVDSIDYIYDEDSIYYAKDTSREELVEFIENLQNTDLVKFKEFFETMPKLKSNLHFKCNKCGYEEDILLEGIESFFV